MDRFFYGLTLILISGTLYMLLEILWTKKTHWTMFFAGGFSVLLIDLFCNGLFQTLPLLLKCLTGAVLITSVELIFGLIFNKILHMRVWDYSGQKYNFQGQICLQYSCYWAVLTLPALALTAGLRMLWF